MRCLCCNKEMNNPTSEELQSGWHQRCVKTFFGTKQIPELDCSEAELEELANRTVNQGLTVPGVQKKLSLHLETVDFSPRLTIVDYPCGFILKPQTKEYDYLPESEFLVMHMANMAGIQTVPFGLIRLNQGLAYITKRVDRTAGGMLAMEDFCQLSMRTTDDKYKGSYERCADIIKTYAVNTGLDLAEFYYRLLFCFITGNSDMHLKNFSLIEESPASRTFHLSPAYDLLPVNIILPEDLDETALTVNGKKRNLRKKDYALLAEKIGISKKTETAFIKRLSALEETYGKMIQESYISREMKEQMRILLHERMNRLKT